MMHRTEAQAGHKHTSNTSAATPVHTTLYDLIDAIEAKVGSNASDVVTASVVQMLKTYRVSCLGDFEGCRMVLDEAPTSYNAVA